MCPEVDCPHPLELLIPLSKVFESLLKERRGLESCTRGPIPRGIIISLHLVPVAFRHYAGI